MSKSSSLIFFGSGPVAAKSLQLLLDTFDIEAVITKPRAPHHRGPVPVLDICEKHGLKTHTPSNRTELSQLFTTFKPASRLGLVIDYGIIINQDVIDSFPLGIVNSHFSLLPQWRGADPITFAILSGQQQTGVSLMLIVAKMDEGPLLAQAPYDIPTKATTPELTNSLIELSDQMLKQILPMYIAGTTTPAPQLEVTMAPSKTPSYSRKLTKDDGILIWNKPSVQLEREIRAYTGWPKSRTELLGKSIIVTQSRVAHNQNDGALVIACNPGWLEITQLIGPSGKTMTGADFLRGYSK